MVPSKLLSDQDSDREVLILDRTNLVRLPSLLKKPLLDFLVQSRGIPFRCWLLRLIKSPCKIMAA